MTNGSTNPNSYLKAFYSNTLVVKDNVLFGGATFDNNNVEQTIIAPVFDWHDTELENGYSIILPKYTKKAHIRVFAPETSFAPKFIAFANLQGATFLLDALNDPKRIGLLDGSELEIYGYTEIKKLILYNNRSNTDAGTGTTTTFNSSPINFLMNLTLYK